jgi:hypothetical protein
MGINRIGMSKNDESKSVFTLPGALASSSKTDSKIEI